MNEVTLSLPDDFQNVVRLFPLPNLVLFPGVIQALHLFEPRYRQLVSDALESDSLIAMALISSDDSPLTAQSPGLARTICIGKIVTHARLEDGRFNLLLMGVRRAKLVREFNHGKLYRMAEVEIVSDVSIPSVIECRRLRENVIGQFRSLLSRRPQLDEESLDQLLDSNLPLGQLLDLIAYSSGASPPEQQAALEESDVAKRGKLVLSMLVQQQAKPIRTDHATADFPPGFSVN